PFLDRQIDIVRPKVLATLGRFSMKYIMEKFGLGGVVQSIGAIHGKIFDADASFGPIKIIPFYHPAATLYNPDLKIELQKDFKFLKKFSEKK
ncbi:MAG: uracil-DNA glycosylase, partial [Candidatus Sungbacteria bacterium]|nr:uracil-DNA glycosylase [Candidatus Sungbacteria bacterium]